MKRQHTIAENILKMTIIFILLLSCVSTRVFATDTDTGTGTDTGTETSSGTDTGTGSNTGTGTDTGTGGTDTPASTNPYLKMAVSTRKVGTSTQITVDCYGKNITKLEGIDLHLAYNPSMVTPSYIEGDNKNNIIENLDAIKYENEPKDRTERETFYETSKATLLNMFKGSTYFNAGSLDIDAFRYVGPDDNNEIIQFLTTPKDENVSISSEDGEIHIGTFSFRLADDAQLDGDPEKGPFSVPSVFIMCDDGNFGDGYIAMYGSSTSGDVDVDEAVDIGFEVQQKGAIVGQIETGYYIAGENEGEVEFKSNTRKTKKKTIYANRTATVYLINKDDIGDLELTATGAKYISGSGKGKNKKPAIRPQIVNFIDKTYYLSDKVNLTTPLQNGRIIEVTLDDKGAFDIEDVEFGDYVVFIDKQNFADYIITDITVNSANMLIDLGTINLIAGDFNKDGIFTLDGDLNPFQAAFELSEEEVAEFLATIEPYGYTFEYDLTDDGVCNFDGDSNIFIEMMESSEGREIKTVISYADIIKEEN